MTPNRIAVLAIVLTLTAAPTVVLGHEQHEHRTGVPSSVADSTMPTHGARAGIERAGPPPEVPRYAMPPMGEAALAHLHNKLVHFPVALTPVALLLLLVERKRPGFAAAGAVIVWFAALGGVASYFAGRAQMEAFRGDSKEWLAGLHQTWGTAAAITLLLWAALTLWKPAKRFLWVWGAVATLVVLTTAFFGGLVAHGE